MTSSAGCITEPANKIILSVGLGGVIIPSNGSGVPGLELLDVICTDHLIYISKLESQKDQMDICIKRDNS